MTTNKYDPWELLREVQDEWLRYHDLYTDGVELDEKLLSRVGAALATREAENQIDWKARSVTLEKALRASCVPGCSHEGESWDEEHGKQRDEEYHAGWIALGESRCGYCGRDHRNTK